MGSERHQSAISCPHSLNHWETTILTAYLRRTGAVAPSCHTSLIQHASSIVAAGICPVGCHPRTRDSTRAATLLCAASFRP